MLFFTIVLPILLTYSILPQSAEFHIVAAGLLLGVAIKCNRTHSLSLIYSLTHSLIYRGGFYGLNRCGGIFLQAFQPLENGPVLIQDGNNIGMVKAAPSRSTKRDVQ